MRILAIMVIFCTLISVGCKSEKSNYDAGIEAYKRGHYTTALYDFEKRANQGDPVGQFCLGYMYKHGQGVRANNEKAAKWYTKAADQGYTPAMNNLAKMYDDGWLDSKGEEVDPDFKKAEKLWEQASKKGNPIAQTNLGFVYLALSILPNLEEIEEHWGFEKTNRLLRLEKAEKLLKAASQELPRASHLLGVVYQIKAEEAANTGDFELANELYKMQENSYKAADNIAKDKEKDAGKEGKDIKGYAPAQNDLGSMYYNGEGVAQVLTEDARWKEAFDWYEKAAEQDHAASQSSLAFLYYLGRGVDQNREKAMELWQKAAEQGYGPAQNALANMFRELAENPALFKQNIIDRFLEYSRKDGEKDKRAAKLYHEMASRWFFRAAQQGEVSAQVNLGQNFKMGRYGVPQDDSEAYYWYGLALRDPDSLNSGENILGETPVENFAAKVTEWHESVGNLLNEEQRKKIQGGVDNWKPKDNFYKTGTGFYIHKNYILTNAHVVTKDDKMKNKYDEFRIYSSFYHRRVELIAWDPDIDLALLYDERGNTNTATFRNTPVYMGEKIVSFGYPLSGVLSYEGNSTSGIVSGRLGMLNEPYPDNYFQHTAPIQGGNSGGPVFDLMGNVVGVTKYGMFSEVRVARVIKIDPPQNVNFAIRFDVVKEFLQKNGFRPDSKNSIDKEKIYKVLDTSTNSPSDQVNTSKMVEKFTVPVLSFKNKNEKPFDDSGILNIGIHDLQP